VAPVSTFKSTAGATRNGPGRARWFAAMSSIARDARVKAAECEKLAATSCDPEIRQHYIQLARDWREMARQRAQLEADLRDLARKEN
jgi:hypothetical protein